MIKKIKNIKINNDYLWILIFILFFPHVFHMYAPSGPIPIFEWLNSRFRILSLFVLCFIFVVLKKKKTSKLLMVLIVCCFWIIFTTIINNPTNIKKALLYVSSALSIAILVECYKENIKELIKGLMLVFEVHLYPNLLTIILFRNSKNQNWYNLNNFFLGTRNDLILYMLPALLVCMLYILYVKKKTRPLCLVAIITLSVILCGSSTTQIAFLLLLLVFIFFYYIRRKNMKYSIIIPILIVLFGAIIVYPYLFFGKNIIVDYLLNNVYYGQSFAERAGFWVCSKEYIFEKPLFGYGYINKSLVFTGIHDVNHGNSHSEFIQLIINYGLVGMVLFSYFNVVLIKEIYKKKSATQLIVSLSFICAIYITFITQAYHRFFEFYLIFFLIYHLDFDDGTE